MSEVVTKLSQPALLVFTDVQVMESLDRKFPQAFSELKISRPGVLTAKLSSRETLLDVCKYLKTKLNFKYLLSVTAVDWPENYEVVYHIVSYENNNIIELHAVVPKTDASIMSVDRVWKGANCHEREAFDLMGIVFRAHPYLKRILLPDDVDFHPLRKDFPLDGHKSSGGLTVPKNSRTEAH